MNADKYATEARSRMFSAAVNGMDINGMIMMGEQLLGNPLIMCNINHNVWYAGKLPEDCGLPCKEGTFIEPTGAFYDLLISQIRANTNCMSTGKYQIFFSPLRYHKKAWGYSYLVAANPPVPGTEELHRDFCDMITLAMDKQHAQSRILQRSINEMQLESILDNPGGEEYDFRDFEGMFPAGRFSEFIVCAFCGRNLGFAPRSDIISKLGQLLGTDICFDYEKLLVSLIPFGEVANKEAEILDFLTQYDMKGAVSFPFDRNRNIRLYYDQAAELLSRGGPDKRLIRFSEELPAVIMKSCHMGTHPESMCIPDILKLNQYDDIHNTALATTLRVFLKSGLMINLTAEKLKIHRNSVQARLEKINFLVGDYVNVYQLGAYFSLLT